MFTPTGRQASPVRYIDQVWMWRSVASFRLAFHAGLGRDLSSAGLPAPVRQGSPRLPYSGLLFFRSLFPPAPNRSFLSSSPLLSRLQFRSIAMLARRTVQLTALAFAAVCSLIFFTWQLRTRRLFGDGERVQRYDYGFDDGDAAADAGAMPPVVAHRLVVFGDSLSHATASESERGRGRVWTDVLCDKVSCVFSMRQLVACGGLANGGCCRWIRPVLVGLVDLG